MEHQLPSSAPGSRSYRVLHLPRNYASSKSQVCFYFHNHHLVHFSVPEKNTSHGWGPRLYLSNTLLSHWRKTEIISNKHKSLILQQLPGRQRDVTLASSKCGLSQHRRKSTHRDCQQLLLYYVEEFPPAFCIMRVLAGNGA